MSAKICLHMQDLNFEKLKCKTFSFTVKYDHIQKDKSTKQQLATETRLILVCLQAKALTKTLEASMLSTQALKHTRYCKISNTKHLNTMERTRHKKHTTPT